MMRNKTKKELQKEIKIQYKIIRLQENIIELLKMEEGETTGKLLADCYHSLLKWSTDNYEGIIITDSKGETNEK